MNKYYNKYLKYKNKYLQIKNQFGSAFKNLPEASTTDNEDYICGICLKQIEEGIYDLDVTQCENLHLFHTVCITEWCYTTPNKCSCPICRIDTVFYPQILPQVRLNRNYLLHLFTFQTPIIYKPFYK